MYNRSKPVVILLEVRAEMVSSKASGAGYAWHQEASDTVVFVHCSLDLISESLI